MMRVLIKMQRAKYEPEDECVFSSSKWKGLRKPNVAMRSELARSKKEFEGTRKQSQWK